MKHIPELIGFISTQQLIWFLQVMWWLLAAVVVEVVLLEVAALEDICLPQLTSHRAHLTR